MIIRFGLLGIFFWILFWWAQPFSKRYQGKTAKDWFAQSVREHGIRGDVVDAFGPELVPFLVDQVDFSVTTYRVFEWMPLWMAGRLEKVFLPQQHVQNAVSWLTVLYYRGHSVLPALYAPEHTNIIISVLAFHTEDELDKIMKEHPSALVKEQAEKAKGLVARWPERDINRLLISTNKASPFKAAMRSESQRGTNGSTNATQQR